MKVCPRRERQTVSLPSSDRPPPLHVLSIASAPRIRWIRYLGKSPRAAVNRQMGVSLPSPTQTHTLVFLLTHQRQMLFCNSTTLTKSDWKFVYGPLKKKKKLYHLLVILFFCFSKEQKAKHVMRCEMTFISAYICSCLHTHTQTHSVCYLLTTIWPDVVLGRFMKLKDLFSDLFLHPGLQWSVFTWFTESIII